MNNLNVAIEGPYAASTRDEIVINLQYHVALSSYAAFLGHTPISAVSTYGLLVGSVIEALDFENKEVKTHDKDAVLRCTRYYPGKPKVPFRDYGWIRKAADVVWFGVDFGMSNGMKKVWDETAAEKRVLIKLRDVMPSFFKGLALHGESAPGCALWKRFNEMDKFEFKYPVDMARLMEIERDVEAKKRTHERYEEELKEKTKRRLAIEEYNKQKTDTV